MFSFFSCTGSGKQIKATQWTALTGALRNCKQLQEISDFPWSKNLLHTGCSEFKLANSRVLGFLDSDRTLNFGEGWREALAGLLPRAGLRLISLDLG